MWFVGGLFIAQGIARFLHRRFNLCPDVIVGIHHQFFGGEQHLYLIHACKLAHGIFHFARTGGAVPVSYTHLDVYKRQGYVHDVMGFSAFWAGLVISLQYFATLLSRPHAGRYADLLGPKKIVVFGLCGCFLSGLGYLTAGLTASLPVISLLLLLSLIHIYDVLPAAVTHRG